MLETREEKRAREARERFEKRDRLAKQRDAAREQPSFAALLEDAENHEAELNEVFKS